MQNIIVVGTGVAAAIAMAQAAGLEIVYADAADESAANAAPASRFQPREISVWKDFGEGAYPWYRRTRQGKPLRY